MIIASNIKRQRIAVGLTVQDVASAIGVTFQSVHKFENGQIRIQSDRLPVLSNLFRCSIDDFFEGAPSEYHNVGAPYLPTFRLLLDSFVRIQDPRTQSALLTVVKALAEASVEAKFTSAVALEASAPG
jgi:transcriptional regulator with XRE-family HTH domain